jgi:hypothetical protein
MSDRKRYVLTAMRQQGLPKGWKCEASRAYDTETIQAITLSRRGKKAGPGYVSDQAVEMELHHNFSGSGDKAFGGAAAWPVLTLNFALPAGQEDDVYELAKL